MNWLYKRRKKLGLTRARLLDRLRDRGLKIRSVSTIRVWEMGGAITPLSKFDETSLLADALEWSMIDLIQAAYDLKLSLDGEDTPVELLRGLEALDKLSPDTRTAAINILVDICKTLQTIDGDHQQPSDKNE